jgi:hypothetical protein
MYQTWAPSLGEYDHDWNQPRRLRTAGFVQLGLGLGLTASLYLLLIGITS